MNDIIDKLGIKPIGYHETGPFKLPLYDPDDVEELEQQRNELFENLFDSCEMICGLCIRLNPQHKDCLECDDLKDLRKPITDKTGKTWEQIKELIK